MSGCSDTSEATLVVIELANWLRAAEALSLHAQTLLSGLDADLPTTAAVTLSDDDLAAVGGICDAILGSVDQLRALRASLPDTTIEVRGPDLARQAAAALALGDTDVAKVELLARCLPVPEGFRALAEMLRCTGYHASWSNASLGDLLGSFRGAETHLVRHITAEAHLSPDALFGTCNREQICRLARVLEDHAR